MKKLVSMCMAVALAVTLAVPALAVTDPAPTHKVGESGDVTLNGTVSNSPADLISVTIPLSIDFTVATDSNEYFSGITHVQGQVVNHSAVPVKMEITKVVDNGSLLPKMDLALAPLSVVGTSNVVDNKTQWTVTDSKAFGDENKYWLNKVGPGNPVELFSSLAANGGTDMITTCGRLTGGSTQTKIPAGTYAVVTTITIGLVPTPAP